MSKKFKAAIIGCGSIAGGYDQERPSASILTHAKAYKMHPDFELIACVEPDLIKRKNFMQYWDIPYGLSHVNELQGHIDVISLCTPTGTHADILDQLLSLPNSVVWAEKPITDNLQRSRAIITNYEKAGRSLVVNYPRRWAVEVQKLKSAIETSDYGNLQKALVFYSRGFLNNGSHAIDLLEFLFGSLVPVRCMAIGNLDIVGDQNIDVQLATQNNSHIYMFGCKADSYSIFEIQLMFDNCRISLINSGFEIKLETVIQNKNFAHYMCLSEPTIYNSGLDVAILNSLNNIHNHLLNSAPLLSTGSTALSVHELCVKLQSMANCC